MKLDEEITERHTAKEKINYGLIFEEYLNGKTANFLINKYNISRKQFFKKSKEFNIKKQTKLRSELFLENTAETYYWAGFIAADGNISKCGKRISIQLKLDDLSHLQKLSLWSGAKTLYFRETIKNNKIIKSCCLNLNSKSAVTAIFKLNIIPNKTRILLPPPKTIYSWHYIRGYFDGDGSISWHKSNNKARIYLASGSLKLLKWIKNKISFIEGVGNPKITYKLDKNSNNKTYCLEYMGFQTINILNKIYENSNKTIRLDRKYNRFIDYKQRMLNQIRNKEEKDNKILIRNMEIVNLYNSLNIKMKDLADRFNLSRASISNIIAKNEA